MDHNESENETISLDLKKVKSIFLNKKLQTILVILFFLLTLYVGVSIRTAGLQNLIDPTTGDYTPLALDPYYFLRVSEMLLETDGNLPEVDTMRYQALKSGWASELISQSTITLFKVMKMFKPGITLNYANVMNPVVFFALGLIVFFLLCWLITKNGWIALVSSFLLSIIPPYLYRTLAGFSDHESIGMFGFFLVLISFIYGLNYVQKKNPKLLYSGIIGLVSGIFTSFSIGAWGGGSKFLFMIVPLAFLVLWLTKKEKNKKNYILFYALWIFGIFISASYFGETFNNSVSFTTGSTSILTFIALGYAIVDSILTKYKLLNKKLEKNKDVITLGILIILGGILYEILIGGFFDLAKVLFNRVVNPFGAERVSLTVAENKQPFLSDWIGQIGNTIFYTFLLGCFIIGGKIASGIKARKLRPLFTISFILFVLGILYTRISSSSILNGENFLSKVLFFSSFLLFAGVTLYIYKKSDWEVDLEWIILAAWMIPMLLAIRSAIRVFFMIAPFVALMVPVTLRELFKISKKSKDEIIKLIGYILLGILIIGLIYTTLSSGGFYNSVKYQAQNQILSYNSDWQQAMSWVRENTTEGGIFIHWWDYGYWIQTGGDRPTVNDGGHGSAFWDHIIGRYLLTTPYPDSAKSVMKTFNASYLLIDPTDIGKYGAYSSIGDAKDLSDRASWLPTLVSDPSQIKETRNGTTKLYRGGFYIDSDIVYELDGKKIFLPKGKAALGGVILEKKESGYSQPQGVFIYNEQQYYLPLRYVASEGMKFDFGQGVNATAYIYPSVVGQNFEVDGALMYLSEKTMNSLVAEVYLMNDPDKKYSNLELVHSEGAYPFNFYYQGFRGPIRIYKITHEEDILTIPGFLDLEGEYGQFDDYKFKE